MVFQLEECSGRAESGGGASCDDRFPRDRVLGASRDWAGDATLTPGTLRGRQLPSCPASASHLHIIFTEMCVQAAEPDGLVHIQGPPLCWVTLAKLFDVSLCTPDCSSVNQSVILVPTHKIK